MSILTDSTPESGRAPSSDFDLLTPVEYVAPRANLLPPEIAERAALRKMQALLAAAVIACGGIVGAGLLHDRPRPGARQAALAQAQAEQQSLNAQKAALAPAQAAHQQVLAAKQSLVAAMSAEVLWSNQLDTLRRRLPDGVRLSTLTVTPIDTTGRRHRRLGTAVHLPAGPGRYRSEQRHRVAPAAAGRLRPPATSPAFRSPASRHDNTRVATFLDTLAAMPGWGNVYLTNTATKSPNNGLVTLLDHGQHHAGSPLSPLHEWELTDEVTRA